MASEIAFKSIKDRETASPGHLPHYLSIEDVLKWKQDREEKESIHLIPRLIRYDLSGRDHVSRP